MRAEWLKGGMATLAFHTINNVCFCISHLNGFAMCAPGPCFTTFNLTDEAIKSFQDRSIKHPDMFVD